MYNAKAVILGIAIFLALMTAPFWLNAGKEHKKLKLELPKIEKECVEPVDWMRANHMQLLDEWRHEVVRSSERSYESQHFEDGHENKSFEKSLTLTCLDCHKVKKNFCDKCHTYALVKPYCWECHVVPEEKI